MNISNLPAGQIPKTQGTRREEPLCDCDPACWMRNVSVTVTVSSQRHWRLRRCMSYIPSSQQKRGSPSSLSLSLSLRFHYQMWHVCLMFVMWISCPLGLWVRMQPELREARDKTGRQEWEIRTKSVFFLTRACQHFRVQWCYTIVYWTVHFRHICSGIY